MSFTFYFWFVILLITGMLALWQVPIWVVLSLATLGLGGLIYFCLGWFLGEFENE